MADRVCVYEIEYIYFLTLCLHRFSLIVWCCDVDNKKKIIIRIKRTNKNR